MVIPDSVTSIGGGAFSGYTSLTSVVIPDSVKTIGEQTFKNCEKFTSITLPKSVKTIRRRAFEGCSNLTYIVIPSSVQNLGSLIFKDCSLDLIVWVEKGSKAEAYCEDQILDYRYWDGSEPEKEEEEKKTDIWGD